MKIGMLGFGTVASATVAALDENRDEIQRRIGVDLSITAVATRTLSKAEGHLPAHCRLTTDIMSVVNDPEIDVVIELLGGIDTAFQAIMQAIENGKHVVTANKELLAKHGNEIFALARQRNVIVTYEAAVAVAIPIIKTIRESMAANRIDSVVGIINGTSNFILSQMRDNNESFADALAEASRLGYAEADPSYDVNGNDAAHKLTILTAIAFGVPLNLAAVHMQGISQLKIEDVRFAEGFGYRIKLLAAARRSSAGLDVRVEPTLIPKDHMLANVNAAMNAVMVNGNLTGTTLHYGAGAGGKPTSSAVLADLIDIGRLFEADKRHHVQLAAYQEDHIQALPILPYNASSAAFYVRLNVADEVGVLASVTKALAEHSVSVDVVHQEKSHEGRTNLVMITHETPGVVLEAALAQIKQFSAVAKEVAVLRVDSLQ